jgi:hypothetical protein
MITTRLLPPEEYSKLADTEPYRTGGLPDPDHWRIIVVEDEGRIVGSCAIFDAVHWDYWHVDEAYRGNPVVFRDLVMGGVQVLVDHNVDLVHTTVPNGQPEVEEMLTRFGFQPAPGRLFYFKRD